MNEQRRGRVIVASSPTTSIRLIPVYVAERTVRYSDVRIIIRGSMQVDVLQLIHTGGTNFGVMVEPLDIEGLRVEPLLAGPLCLVCRKNHPLA